MFSHQEIAHFRTFGFVVSRGLFRDTEISALTAEVTEGLQGAFGGIGTDTDPDGTGGIRGDYLPLSVDRAPLSQSLIADDPRLFQGSTELLGRPTVPTPPIATCFTGDAGWHTEQGWPIGGVEFLAHLQPRTARTGALRVIPGSHGPAFARRVRGYLCEDPGGQGFAGWQVPSVVIETEPGDVIALDVHLFNSSRGGRDRLAWTIEYLPWPGITETKRLRGVRDLVIGSADYHGYDREAWPAWREWAAGARKVPSRRLAVERLRLLGVLGDRGAPAEGDLG